MSVKATLLDLSIYNQLMSEFTHYQETLIIPRLIMFVIPVIMLSFLTKNDYQDPRIYDNRIIELEIGRMSMVFFALSFVHF